MATAAQILANRANAQKSTGPRTADGKENSRRNAIDHNLTGTRCLRTKEEQAAFDAYSDRLLPTLTPADDLQLEIATRIVSTMFRLAQVPTIEANMIAAVRFAKYAGFDENQPPNDLDHALSLGRAFLQNSRTFNNLSLYEQRLSRGMAKDLDLLRQMQKERKSAPHLSANAQLRRGERGCACPAIGFVSSIPEPDAAPPPSTAQVDLANMAA